MQQEHQQVQQALSAGSSAASSTATSQKPYVWTNMDHIMGCLRQHSVKPQERWGHASICAHDQKMFIIGGYQGQYLGDIWEYDFTRCAYLKHKLIGQDAALLERSNHTAVFYEPENSIYVFGGGQAQRLRFNDTLQLQLPKREVSLSGSQTWNAEQPETVVSRMLIQEGSPMPSPRTYHASCLVGKFMVISGGEANNTDLNDMWALDLTRATWSKLELISTSRDNAFSSKRFHTVSAISGHRVITFGGCHSEYVHLNDVNIVDMSSFIASDGSEAEVSCIKLDFKSLSFGQVPSTRWGHAATVYQDKLFVLGGRNNDDINDLHCFDLATMKWSQLEVGHPMPKPRRRHSAVFVSSTLVMFGGFDGDFYNDMQVLCFDPETLSQGFNQNSQLRSSLLEDYAKLVDSKEHSNITFLLDPASPGLPQQEVQANKSLVLFRLFEREVREYCQDSRIIQMRMEEVLSSPQTKSMCPHFFQRVFDAKPGSKLHLPGICTRTEFLLFLEFCYCDRLVTPVTGAQIARMRHICQVLGLATVTQYFDSLAQHIYNKLHAELVKDFESKLMQQLGGAHSAASILDSSGNPVSNLTVEQRLELEKSVNELMQSVKFNFNQLDSPAVVQSPEDRVEKQNHIIHAEMVKCRNLDHFFDVIFELDGKHLMRANSAVLHARCEYFKIMFDSKYGFQESSCQDLTLTDVKHSSVRYVVVRGISKQYFTAIIQFLYTDNFCQTETNLAFFLRLLIYADYFMIGKLAELCQDILRHFVKPKNVLDLYLVAHAHNAAKLERYCINFLAINLSEIQKGTQWRDFQKKCKQYGKSCLLSKVKKELELEQSRNFVSISLQRCIQNVAKADWPRYDFGQVSMDVTPVKTENTTNSQQNESRSDLGSSLQGSLPQTPTRDGITVVQQTATAPDLKKKQQIKRSTPSHGRDALPAIVKVATDVTQRIVDSSIVTDSDFEMIMSAPNYIYFEEHPPLAEYPQSKRRPVLLPLSAYQANNFSNCMLEEVKEEGFIFVKPHHSGSKTARKPSKADMWDEADEQDTENCNPNSTVQIQTGWRPRPRKQASSGQKQNLSAMSSQAKNVVPQSSAAASKQSGSNSCLNWR